MSVVILIYSFAAILEIHTLEHLWERFESTATIIIERDARATSIMAQMIGVSFMDRADKEDIFWVGRVPIISFVSQRLLLLRLRADELS
jgi:hypothetical protein